MSQQSITKIRLENISSKKKFRCTVFEHKSKVLKKNIKVCLYSETQWDLIGISFTFTRVLKIDQLPHNLILQATI